MSTLPRTGFPIGVGIPGAPPLPASVPAPAAPAAPARDYVMSAIRAIVESDPRGSGPDGLNGPILGQLLSKAGIRPQMANFGNLGDAVRLMAESGQIQLRVAPGGQIFVWRMGAVAPAAVPMQAHAPVGTPTAGPRVVPEPGSVLPAPSAGVRAEVWTPRTNPFRTEVWQGMVYERFQGEHVSMHRATGEVRKWREEAPTPPEEWVDLPHIDQDLQRQWAQEFLRESALESRVNWGDVNASVRWFESFGATLEALGGTHRRDWNTFRHRRVQKRVSEWAAAEGISETMLYASGPRPAPVPLAPVAGARTPAEIDRMRDLTWRAYELVILSPDLDTRTRAQLVLAALRPGGWLTGG